MFQFYLLISIIIIHISALNEEKENKYVITNFSTKYPYPDEKNYFYSNYTNNYLFADIRFGTHQQNLETKIDLNSYEVYISKEDIVDKSLYIPYNISNSKNFNTSYRFYSQKSEFSTALLSKDTLTVNDGQKDIKLDNFFFAYVDEGFKKFAGSVGFNLLKTVVYPVESMNYIDQLKNNSIISGYSLTIKFTSNYKGQLIIGPDIDDIMPKEVKGYTKKVVKASYKRTYDNGHWELDLNRVIVGESELLYSKLPIFDLKYDFIIATDEFSEYISKNYFSELFGTEKCFKEELPSFKYYLGIKCLKDVNIKNFPDINFDITSDYEKFNLIMNYEDLFEKKGDYIYFKIIIISNEISSISINEQWILGKDFFRQNLITFNKDRKDISIYYKEKSKKNEKKEDSKKIDKTVIWLVILIVILVIMAGIIIYLLIKCINQNKLLKKRSRLNILEDEFDDNINN